jgi:hypothetical protein
MPRWLARLGSVGMALVALVLAHNLIYLVAYGAAYEDALQETGHDAGWTLAVVVILGLTMGLTLAAAGRILQLWVEIRSLGGRGAIPRPDPTMLMAGLGVLWLRLAVATTAALLVQENVERWTIGQPLPGLGVLGSAAYPDAMPILLVVTLAAAAVGALFRWRIETLAARVAAARRRGWARPLPTARRTIPLAHPLAGSVHGRRSAGRAPPIAVALS